VPKCSVTGLTATVPGTEVGAGAGTTQLYRLLQGSPVFWFDLALYCIDDGMRDTALQQLHLTFMVDSSPSSSSSSSLAALATGAHSRADERAHSEAQERAADRAVDRAVLSRHMGRAVFWRCHDPHQELTPLLEVMAAAGLGTALSQEWSRVLVEGVLLGLASVSDWGRCGSGSDTCEGAEPALTNVTMYDRAGLVCEALAILVGRHVDHAMAGVDAPAALCAGASPGGSASATTSDLDSLRAFQYWFVNVATPVLEMPTRRPLIRIFLRHLIVGVISSQPLSSKTGRRKA
jgi:hypothetical protein